MKRLITILMTTIMLVFGLNANGAWNEYDDEYTYRGYIYHPEEEEKWFSGKTLPSGWFSLPVQYMYSTNGTREIVYKSEVPTYKRNGWYENLSDVSITMYALDGRSKTVYKDHIEANKKVGWYVNLYEVQTTMYAPDGRSKIVFKANVDKEKAVGWYTEPVQYMYAPDGRKKVVYKKDVEANKAVGWYENLSEIQVTMYAPDGRSKVVFKANVEKEKAVGWYTYPVQYMYAPDGRTKVVAQKDVEANKKVGWYENMADFGVVMFAKDGRTKFVFSKNVEAEKKVGWYTANGLVATLDNTALEIIYIRNEKVQHSNKILSELRKAWRNKVGPLAVIYAQVEEDYGTPEVEIYFHNLSDKIITSFECKTTCYDAYGNATSDGSYISATRNLVCDREHLESKESFKMYWKLYSNERTHSVSVPIITKIAFDDGSTWYR